MKLTMDTATRFPDFRKALAVGIIILALTFMPPRNTRGEDSIDIKTMYYMEDHDRIQVIAPTFMVQKEFANGLTIKIDGIFNSISGATPTGAPYVPGTSDRTVTTTVYSPGSPSTPTRPTPSIPSYNDDDEDEHEDEDEDEEDEDEEDHRALGPGGRLRSLLAGQPFMPKAGATPAPEPPPAPAPSSDGGSSGGDSGDGGGGGGGGTATTQTTSIPGTPGYLPMATEFSEERIGINIGVTKRMGRHLPGIQAAFSSEHDYTSLAGAVQDAIEFNKKNTTLLTGIGYTHDLIKPANNRPNDTKDTIDGLIGVTQVLDTRTLLTLAFTLSRVDGFLSDPYKVVELNGVETYEQRPEHKNKQTAYLALTRYIDAVRGSIEGSYRLYNDSFGILAHTYSLAWYQKIGDHFIVRPLVRLYNQTEADFYAERFTGNPEFYSSDYRVSALEAVGYDLKLVWMPTATLAFDIEYERYQQQGTDGITPDIVYPSANVIIIGARLIF